MGGMWGDCYLDSNNLIPFGICLLRVGSGVAGAGCVVCFGFSDTFPISFFQGLSFLHLEITLPFAKLCYAFEEKNFFSVTMIL